MKTAAYEVFGPELKDITPGTRLHFAMVAEVAGRNFQEDFEPILERQNHHLINQAQGIMHIGQRDIAWIRISKQAVEKGFTLADIGKIIHAKYHQDFGAIFDKVQIRSTRKRRRSRKCSRRRAPRTSTGTTASRT